VEAAPPPLFIGNPRGRVSWHPSLLETFWENIPKGDFSINIPKSIFTIHDDIFQRPVELKIFMWA